MFHIQRFILDNKKAELSIGYASNKIEAGETVNLSYEFIRVMSPQGGSGKPGKMLISHKKTVQLLAIESVAKHGYRLFFDDQHSAVYGEAHLQELCQHHNQLWQQYLGELKKMGHSREAMINITQL